MAGFYRASIGHNPLIRVKKQSVGLVGQGITLTPGPGGGGDSRGGGTTFGLGWETTNVNVWGTTSDVVTGWDWTYPSAETAVPQLSGMFQFVNDLAAWPAGFPGKIIFKINADWRDLEPTQGNYNLSQFNQLSTLSTSWGGVQIDVRGAVPSTTAPTWITNVTIDGNGNYNIGDPDWYGPFRLLITQIANFNTPSWQGTVYKIPAHPRLVTQIVHGSSSSAGEEAGFGTPSQNHVDTIIHWATSYGVNKSKLGWCGEGRPQYDNNQTIAAGIGSRGGFIENWIQSEYTPRRPAAVGESNPLPTSIGQEPEQYYNSSGVAQTNQIYLVANPAFLPVGELRHFADQGEAYQDEHLSGGGNAKPWGAVPEKWGFIIRMLYLRVLQMRRNVLAVEKPESFKNNTGATNVNGREGFINPEMMKWTSLQLGRRTDGLGGANVAPKEAFCCLLQTWTRATLNLTSSATLTIHNFERWLTQREAWGGTAVDLNFPHGFDPTISTGLTTAQQSTNVARRMSSATTGMGFRLDDSFLTRGVTTSVAVKVVYLDNNTQAWTLNYRNSAGSPFGVSPTNANVNSGNVRTATFFLPTFCARSSAVSDLELKGSTTTPFMFMRVIKV
jgi:hypothetical protein